jgi:hypothetical protein
LTSTPLAVSQGLQPRRSNQIPGGRERDAGELYPWPTNQCLPIRCLSQLTTMVASVGIHICQPSLINRVQMHATAVAPAKK